MNHNKVRLAEQALAAHKAKLSTTTNKDQVRRQIKAMEQRLRKLKAEE